MTTDNSNSKKMKRKEYEKHLLKLQEELCRLQDWVKAEGKKVIVLFEGRDAAGKGGTIKAITERVSPRVFRVVATLRIFPPPVKSSSSTEVGTTGRASNT
jgi:polyphosphate kinase 2 (PPK2 family)